MKIDTSKAQINSSLTVGIDIGTTTVSAVVYDIDNNKLVNSFAIPHNSYVISDVFSEQSVSAILKTAEELLYSILDSYSSVVSIGLTGQMHGIVYIDKNGFPLSELINWQDKRSDIRSNDGKTTYERITEITGEHISAGYGIATHYYNLKNALVPNDAVAFCSIIDLFAIKICGLSKPKTHSSIAASFGMYDLKNNEFMLDKLTLLGIEPSFLPAVTNDSIIIGECRGVPVSVAIGDNQASFLGSVGCNDESILVNIGTGSQISAISDYVGVSKELELRPFIEGKYLVCGSALCGGSAYSILEKFFRSYAVSVGVENAPQYSTLNRLAEEAFESGENGLDVDVSFFGKRSNPNVRGSVNNIDNLNFTPANLALGVLKGMCNELYSLYLGFNDKKKSIIASGGAVKNNKLLPKLIAERFGMTVSINSNDEEAALGAALFSAFSVGKIEYNNGFSEFVN